jgi:integration host factor subunit alpha
MVMIKADIAEKISETNGFSKKDSVELVEAVLEIMKSTLESGENLNIQCFGSFVVRHKANRRGRNPQTGEEMTISNRKVVTFKPSKVLDQKLNKLIHQ